MLKKHPEIKGKLFCIDYKENKLTTAEKQQLRAANKEVPPTPEPPTDSDDDKDLTKSQVVETEKTD